MSVAPTEDRKITASVREVLQLEALKQVKIIAGRRGLNRSIRWVHVIDIPEIAPWLHGGELLLTTGYGWPKHSRIQRDTLRALNKLSLAGILFGPGLFIEKVPPAVLQEANRLDLPILEAPLSLKFIDVTEAIHKLLMEKSYALLTRLEQIHRTLTRAALEAEDLQHIADVMSQLIHRPVTIENAEFRLLAYSNGDQCESLKDKARMETIRQEQTPTHILRILKLGGFLQRLQEAKGTVRIPPIPEAGMGERVVCPIRTAHELLGYVWILEGTRALSELDVRTAEQAATLAALHIIRQQAVTSVERRVQYTFVDALIRGEFDRSAAIRERAHLLGFNSEACYAVAILTIAPSSGRGRRWALSGLDDYEMREQYGRILSTALQHQDLHQFMTFLLNQIVFLLPDVDGWPRVKSHADQIWKALRDHDPSTPLNLTIGEIHKGAAGVTESYHEAEKLAEIVQPLNGIYYYHEHTLAQLLQRADTTILKKLLSGTEAKLGNHSDVGVLSTTLLTLLANGFNLRKTAKCLGLHRNTIQQRLARIRQVYKTPLDDPKFWAQLILVAEAKKYKLDS